MGDSVMDIPILFDNEELLVINKPAGLVVHPDGKTKEPTLVDWILENYPNIAEVGEPWITPQGKQIPRPGIVHRLDKETSGVLIIAKTQETFLHLKQQFQEHLVTKIYNAFVYGVMKNDSGVIDRPIGKNRTDFRLWSAQRGARGTLREALTNYTVLKRLPEHTFVELSPKTGRTHQLRVHLKAINHPIVCDQLYAPNRACALGFSRLALHAKSISFTARFGEILHVEAPFPEDFKYALSTI